MAYILSPGQLKSESMCDVVDVDGGAHTEATEHHIPLTNRVSGVEGTEVLFFARCRLII
jgi:hypothetical protein